VKKPAAKRPAADDDEDELRRRVGSSIT
jgi:hypothetical protein